MTDLEVGEMQEDGTYPEETFNDLVSKRLVVFAEVGKKDGGGE
jgi:hypothetical protein